MKYIMLCIITLLVCLGCAWTPVLWIGRKKKLKWRTILLMASCSSLMLIFAITFGYLSIYYHADETAEITSPNVQMKEIDGGYYFDGPGTDNALIFYPGAKVETLAYAPLMTLLAEQGVDCFLADMPFRIAFFDSNIADRFLNNYSYDNWTAAGHSLGGIVVSGYASEHADQIDNLILLAAYPNSLIPDGIRFCSIYGTRDGCLNLKSYEQSKIYWSSSACEHALEGGNHAQYANYGSQSGDFEAEITSKEQQALTAELMLEVIANK